MRKKVRKKMKIIGITGGVGAGKTKLLGYVEKHYRCRIILADEVAHLLEEPGQKCHMELVKLLGEGILNPDGTIDKKRMAEKIFVGGDVLKRVNDIVHPAVKEYILREIEREKELKESDFLFVEAALLIEDGYDKILDELWYVHAEPEARRSRLKEGRAYSDEKIDGILKEQLSEEEFRRHCGAVIDNSGSLADACRQIDEKLEEYLCQK